MIDKSSQIINELQLELTTSCNSMCSMCPRTQLERGIGVIDTVFAKRIIDEAISCGAKMLKPQWFGEGMLSHNWEEIVSYAKKKGMRIVMFTNGSLVNDKNILDICRYVDKVFFSIDSHKKEVYERIRVGLKFDVVLENLNQLFKKGRSQVIVIGVKNRDTDVGEFEAFFSRRCDMVMMVNDNYNVRLDGKNRQVMCRHNVKNRLVVGYNGFCYLCCHDWLGKHKIGDLNKQTIQEIWMGEQRKKLLENLQNLEICQRCMLSLER